MDPQKRSHYSKGSIYRDLGSDRHYVQLIIRIFSAKSALMAPRIFHGRNTHTLDAIAFSLTIFRCHEKNCNYLSASPVLITVVYLLKHRDLILASHGHPPVTLYPAWSSLYWASCWHHQENGMEMIPSFFLLSHSIIG